MLLVSSSYWSRASPKDRSPAAALAPPPPAAPPAPPAPQFVVPSEALARSPAFAGLVSPGTLVAANLSFTLDFDRRLGTGTLRWRLKGRSECRSPLFALRLSGSALVAPTIQRESGAVDWQDQGFEAAFELPTTGIFYIELLFLYCTVDEENLLANCIERDSPTAFAPVLGPLIAAASSLDPPISPFNWSLADATRTRPSWGWIRPASATHDATPVRWQEPFYFVAHGAAPLTRYPNFSWNKSRQRFHDYAFVPPPELEQPDVETLVRELIAHAQTRKQAIAVASRANDTATLAALPLPLQICFVGDSHARVMVETLVGGPVTGALHVHALLQFHNAEYPRGAANAARAAVAAGCTHISFQIGQWPASERDYADYGNRFGIPFGTSRYARTMRELVHAVNALPFEQSLFLTVNPVPMGYFATECPPVDGRVPVAFDAFNRELVTLMAEQRGSELVNNLDIMQPMWDFADDFCHPVGAPMQAMAERVLHRVLKSVLAPAHK